MDDKLQNQTNPIQASQSTPNVVQTPPPPAKVGDNKKTMMWFVGGLVLVILVVGVIYLLSSQQQKSQTVPTPSPKAAVEENLEQDLNAVNIEDVKGEFTTVDSDLQKL